MRTSTITIAGEERLLCFSTRVVRSCTERFGALDGLFTSMADRDKTAAFDSSIWILAQMMDAGARYAKKLGIQNPPPLTEDDLLDLCGVDDLTGIQQKISETIVSGGARTVEARPSKNTEAARDEAEAAPRGTSGTD